MQIFVVSLAFERPIDTRAAPTILKTLSAQGCAACHRNFYDEWSAIIHSQAWSDPYFQVDSAIFFSGGNLFASAAEWCLPTRLPLWRLFRRANIAHDNDSTEF